MPQALALGRLMSCRFMSTAIVLQVIALQNANSFNQPEGDAMTFLKNTAANKAVKALLLVGLVSAGA